MARGGFAQMLKDRRAFVEGGNPMIGAMSRYGQGGGNPNPGAGLSAQDLQNLLAQQLGSRAGFFNNNENTLKDTVNSQIQNGSNGVPINPVAAKSDLYDFYNTNQNRMDSLLSNLLGSANTQQGHQIDMFNAQTGRQNANTEQFGQQQTQGRSNFQAGYGGYGNQNGQTSTMAQQYVDAIKNGQADISSINNLEPGMQSQVHQLLNQQLPNLPSKPYDDMVLALHDAYFNPQSGEIAGGNSLGGSAQNALGGLLAKITGGGKQTQRYQDIQNYDDLRTRLKNSGDKTAQTIYGMLPTSGDSDAAAKKKFQDAQNYINSTIYPGGRPKAATAKRPALNSIFK